MRAVILSDSHGMGYGLVQMLQRIWAMNPGKIDAYIHCGDGVSDVLRVTDVIHDRDPKAEIHFVRGNCDWLNEDDAGVEEIFRFGGANVLLCHGHLYQVKRTLTWLDEEARSKECSVVLYGHTHEPNVEPRSALLVNPGSAQDGCFAILDAAGGKVDARLYRV